MPTSLARSRLRVLTGREQLPSFAPARSALSLHCHTHHSKEILDYIPQYAAHIPVVTKIIYFLASHRLRPARRLALSSQGATS